MKPLLIFLLSLSITISAQETGKDWLKKMNDKYATASSIQLNFEASYHNTHTLTSPQNTMKGNVMYTGNNYYSNAMGQEIIVSKKSMLIVDKAEKTITCLPGNDGKKKNTSAVSWQPDSAWLAATEITLSNTSGPTRTVIIKEKNSIYESTEIVINATTYAMEQVTYYYNAVESGAKPSFVVKYSNVKFNATIPDAQFSEKKYIQRKGGKISPAPAWKDYTIIDLTDRYKN